MFKIIKDYIKKEKENVEKQKYIDLLNLMLNDPDLLVDLPAKVINAQSLGEKESILMFAVKQHNINDFKRLMNSKIDVNLVDINGRTALMYAADLHQTYIPALIKAGADVNIKDNNGDDALLIAVKKGQLYIEDLLQAGANVNVQDKEGYTPLIHTVYSYFKEEKMKNIVISLLKYGADTSLKTNQGDTVFHMLGKTQNNEVYKFIRTLLEKKELQSNTTQANLAKIKVL